MKFKAICKDKYFRICIGICIFMCIILYGRFLGGDAVYIYPADIGSDTWHTYLPYYKYIIESVKSGRIASWSFSMGIGSNVLTMGSLIFDPFNVANKVY